MGGLGAAGVLALDKMRRKKKAKTVDQRAMEVGDVTGETKMAYGGSVKKMAKGGSVTRGDGACMKGHTKGKMY
jgi:hypothetical protein